MFSGLVAGQGVVRKIEPTPRGYRLGVDHRGLLRRLRKGDSIAIDGCCLTLILQRGTNLEFDLLEETWLRTSFQWAKRGQRVNVETSLLIGDVLGGHFVTGHIDEAVRIHAKRQREGDTSIQIRPSSRMMKWIVEKGSVALDGVSLTVSKVDSKGFEVRLIPHTLEKTTLGWKEPGEWVNLEGDILAKYAQKGR